MICVLRIGGAAVDPDAVTDILKLDPCRIDTPGQRGAETICLHFDVADAGSSKDLVSQIEDFLARHAASMAALSRLDGVAFRLLDVGLMLDDNKVMISMDLGAALIRRLSEFDLSLSISTYLTDSRA